MWMSGAATERVTSATMQRPFGSWPIVNATAERSSCIVPRAPSGPEAWWPPSGCWSAASRRKMRTLNCLATAGRHHKIRRRYGAVGKWQGVAVIDRFFGALKAEYAKRWMLFLPTRRIEEHLKRYVLWHGRHRPHQGLGGRTPDEVFFARRNRVPRETIRGLRLTHLAGDRRLPVYQRGVAA